MRKLANLKGAKILNRMQQQRINGGATPGCPGYTAGGYSFGGGNGYRGCGCVDSTGASWGSAYTGTTAYVDSSCGSDDGGVA